MTDTVDRALGVLATAIGYLLAALVVLFLVGALLPRGGSLDDLTAEQIKSVVNGGTR